MITPTTQEIKKKERGNHMEKEEVVILRQIARDVTELKSDVAELKSDVAELKSDVIELKNDVAELKSDVTELKSDVAELKRDVTELKSDVTTLKSDVSELKSRVGKLEDKVETLDHEVSLVKKDTTEIKLVLENEIRRNIGFIADGHTNILRLLKEALSHTETFENLGIRVSYLDSKVNKLEKICFSQ